MRIALYLLALALGLLLQLVALALGLYAAYLTPHILFTSGVTLWTYVWCGVLFVVTCPWAVFRDLFYVHDWNYMAVVVGSWAFGWAGNAVSGFGKAVTGGLAAATREEAGEEASVLAAPDADPGAAPAPAPEVDRTGLEPTLPG